MRPVIHNYGISTTTGVALAQAPTSGVAFTLNPTTYDTSNIAVSQVVYDNGNTQRSVSLTSTGNISAILFTVVGFNQQPTLVSQTITGPSNNTVYTSAIFSTVLSVTPNGSNATQVSVGKGPDGVTRLHIPSQHVQDFDLGFGVMVSGSAVYTVQHTFDDVFVSAYPTLRFFNNDDTALVAATGSQDGNYAFNVGGIQVAKTDTGTGSLTIVYRQAGF